MTRHAVTRDEAEDRLDGIVDDIKAFIANGWASDSGFSVVIDDLYDLIRDLTPVAS